MNASGSVILRCTVLSLLLAAISTLSAQNTLIRREPLEARRTLTVIGDGEATGLPDQAVVRLGTTIQADEAAAAQLRVNEVMQKATDQIEKTGVPRRSIRTSGLTLTPVYSSQQPGRSVDPRVTGYRAGNVVEVTVDDIKLVGKVIDAGLGAGANRVEGVVFGLKDDLAQRQAALREAIDKARKKAQSMAEALDVPLGNVREVVEGGVQLFPQERMGMSRALMATDAMQTPVEPGEIRVRASVTIHYDLGGGK